MTGGAGILGSFAFARGADYIVGGLIDGIILATPAAYIALVLAIGSPLVALYAMLTIGMVVVSLFAFVNTTFGWQMGQSEALAGSIIFGFAIDYCVHVAHACEPHCVSS